MLPFLPLVCTETTQKCLGKRLRKTRQAMDELGIPLRSLHPRRSDERERPPCRCLLPFPTRTPALCSPREPLSEGANYKKGRDNKCSLKEVFTQSRTRSDTVSSQVGLRGFIFKLIFLERQDETHPSPLSSNTTSDAWATILSSLPLPLHTKVGTDQSVTQRSACAVLLLLLVP